MTQQITERLIDVTFTLGAGTFDESGTDTVTLSGHRVSVRIQKAGGPAKNLSEIDIYGMSLSLMNRMSTLGLVWQLLPRNTVAIEAGDAQGKSLVFKGTIISAAADFQGAPRVPFKVQAQAGAAEAVVSVPASSFLGTVAVSKIMEQIAAAMGLSLENSLVQDVYLTNQNLPGTAFEQMRRAAAAANIGATVDDGVLVIYNLSQPRRAGPVVISPSTGMVEYPTYISQGLMVRTLFNPAIRFHGRVTIQDSIVKQANGTWLVGGMDHALDAQLPNGDWFSSLYLYSVNPSTPPPVLQ